MEQLPKSQELVSPLLLVLEKAGKPLSNSEMENGVISELGIPATLASSIHSGKRTELQYRLAWARTKAKSSGFIAREDREVWKLTELGKNWLLAN